MTKEPSEMTPSEAGEAVAHQVMGTCSTVEGWLDHFGLDPDLAVNEQFCQAFDDVVFCCESCGWYCSQDEANENPNGGGDICDDCS